MDFSGIYLVLGIFILGMNVIPAFMPPTWTVLVFFYLTYHLYPPYVVLIGAVTATLGRVFLYYLAQTQLKRFLTKKMKDNYAHLAKFVNTRQKISIPLFFTYAFLPIPSNQVYIAAGVSGIRLKFIATIFFIGRLISYSLWIGTAHVAFKSLDGIFGSHYSHITTFIVEIVGFIIIYFLGTINWKKYLKLK